MYANAVSYDAWSIGDQLANGWFAGAPPAVTISGSDLSFRKQSKKENQSQAELKSILCDEAEWWRIYIRRKQKVIFPEASGKTNADAATRAEIARRRFCGGDVAVFKVRSSYAKFR